MSTDQPDKRGTPPGDQSKPEGRRREGTEHEGRAGNLPFQATEEQRLRVRTLAKAFPEHTNKYIALLMGFSESTLKKHFRHDLDYGRAEMGASIAAQVISAALDANAPTAKGDRDLQKFVLARRFGWSTAKEEEDKRGQTPGVVDLSKLSKEDLALYGRLAAIAEGLNPEEVVGSAESTTH